MQYIFYARIYVPRLLVKKSVKEPIVFRAQNQDLMQNAPTSSENPIILLYFTFTLDPVNSTLDPFYW